MFDNIMFDEEILFTYIGYAAGLATILTFAIQILRIIETKNVTNLSSYMYIIYSLGLVCWFAYGVYIDSYILLFSNLITFFCTFIILILIIYYDAEDKIERERRDDITTVYNRKYFEQAVPEKIAQALVAKQNFALVMLKVDNLAEFRQKYGDQDGGQSAQAGRRRPWKKTCAEPTWSPGMTMKSLLSFLPIPMKKAPKPSPDV